MLPLACVLVKIEILDLLQIIGLATSSEKILHSH
jgi:hypothetical protein